MNWEGIALVMGCLAALAAWKAWKAGKELRAERERMARNLQPTIDRQGTVPWGNDEVAN